MNVQKISIVALAAALLAGATGCSAQAPTTSGAQTSETQTNEPTAAQGGAEVSRVKEYSTLDELIADSDLIAVVEVTDERKTSTCGDFECLNAVVKPVDVLKGDAAGPISIVNAGAPESSEPAAADSSLVVEPLTPGTTHLVFLADFENTPGDPTGEYVRLGVFAGDYIENADGTYERRDPESPKLPEQLSLEEVRQAIAAGA